MVDRGSTEHSPRLDDELARETQSLTHGAPDESRVEEWRQEEPPGDGELSPDARVTVDDIELRSQLAASLRPSAFPGNRADLRAAALSEHAEPEMLALLARLPADTEFATFEAVWEALGGHPETREHRPKPRAPRPPERQPEPSPEPAPAPEPAAAAPAGDPLATGVALVFGVVSATVSVAIEVTNAVVRRLRHLV